MSDEFDEFGLCKLDDRIRSEFTCDVNHITVGARLHCDLIQPLSKAVLVDNANSMSSKRLFNLGGADAG